MGFFSKDKKQVEQQAISSIKQTAEPVVNNVPDYVQPAQTSEPKTASVTGSAGTLSVLVPCGWADFITESALDSKDSYGIKVYIDTGSEFDPFYAPAVKVSIFCQGEMFGVNQNKDMFSNSSDLAPLALGNYIWNGYTGLYDDYPTTVLWAEEGKNIIEITIVLKTSKGEISLENKDVRDIIASVSF